MALVILRASPECRAICPPEFVEGLWKSFPDPFFGITIHTAPGVPELVVEPTGKWEHNDSLQSAPVYEVRYRAMGGVVHSPHPGKGSKATACGLTWDDWEKIKKPGEQDISDIDERVNCSKCTKGKK